jgi:hypothetical protein
MGPGLKSHNYEGVKEAAAGGQKKSSTGILPQYAAIWWLPKDESQTAEQGRLFASIKNIYLLYHILFARISLFSSTFIRSS